MLKKVQHLIPAEDVDMGGIAVKQALPTQQVSNVGPFILLHHGIFNFRSDAPAIHQGIGPHPHRGFSPVTLVVDGEIHHRDSFGNSQIAHKGEVQWMHAGAGITHSERPSEALVQAGGTQEVIQLWINSPAAYKMQPPSYSYLSNSRIRTYLSEDGAITNKVIAGRHNGTIGNITPLSDLLVLWASSTKEGSQTHTIADGHETMIYVIKGSIRLAGYGLVSSQELAVFSHAGTTVELTSYNGAQYLLLTGKPIDEKMLQHGPFVMNSETEILEAMRDYQMGKMGVLIEE